MTLCAQQEMQVVSGGAKGVDQVAMLGCLQEGGSAIAVLADSLIKASVSSKYREAIKQGRLTLISPYHPDAGFSVGNAMGRNKYIYGLADYALIISSSVEKGGTWAGAVEALDKIKTIPVLVRNEGDVPSGNLKLLEISLLILINIFRVSSRILEYFLLPFPPSPPLPFLFSSFFFCRTQVTLVLVAFFVIWVKGSYHVERGRKLTFGIMMYDFLLRNANLDTC